MNIIKKNISDNQDSKTPNLTTNKDDLDTVNHSNINEDECIGHSAIHDINGNGRDNIPSILNPTVKGELNTVNSLFEHNLDENISVNSDFKIHNFTDLESDFDVNSSNINEGELDYIDFSVEYSIDVYSENIHVKSNGNINNRDISTALSSSIRVEHQIFVQTQL